LAPDAPGLVEAEKAAAGGGSTAQAAGPRAVPRAVSSSVGPGGESAKEGRWRGDVFGIAVGRKPRLAVGEAPPSPPASPGMGERAMGESRGLVVPKGASRRP